MTYRVRHIPGSSDTPREAHFAVTGADVAYFARAAELASTMQRALNRPPLTALERDAIRSALALVLAGETDDSWTERSVNAMRTAMEKLS